MHTLGAAKESYSMWRLCNWSGMIFLVGYVFSWGLLGFNIPPFEPAISQAELYEHYTENNFRIRTAMALSVFFMPIYFVFSSVISCVMRKIEGANGPLAVVEQMGGATTVVVGCVAGISWLTAAFRTHEWAPETVRQLHDFGWLFFDTTYMCTSLQMIAMSLVFLSDKRETPLIPRWLSWYTIFVAVIFLPLTLLPFFYSGPFAWSGMFNYWVTLGTWFFWVGLLSVYMYSAINRIEREETGANSQVLATNSIGQTTASTLS